MPIALGVLLALILFAPGEPAPALQYECAIQSGPPARVRVFRSSGQTRRQVGPELTYRHRAKMASAADVDGDGRLDLLVLVWKTTRYDPRPGWRPFVYTLRDGEWTPKWLGSRVGHPLLEAAFVRTPQGVRMLTIEDFGDGRTGFTLYHWRGFGFWGEWTGPSEPTFSDLRVADEDGDGTDEISVSDGQRRTLYQYRDGGYMTAASTEGRK